MAEPTEPYDVLTHLINNHLADHLNTMLEAVIVGYSNGKVDVRPIGNKVYTDGDSNAYPTLSGLKLHWPQGDGGQAGMKVPVKVGDKCMVIFPQHPQDDADPENTRRFSLADGYVIPGCGYDDARPANDNLQMYYKEAFIEITPDGTINIKCKKLNIDADDTIQVGAKTSLTVDTPQSTFAQKVTVNGLLSFTAGAAGSGDNGSGQVVRFAGRIVTDAATINGKDFMTHFHLDSGGSGNGGAVG